MDIDRLQNFITVAEELNISRAAEILHMCQPPLSKQIQRLETELGAKLFDRKPKLQLTQAGKAFLAEARIIQATLKQAAYKTKQIHQGELAGTFGYLTVGFTSAMANGILPNILKFFRQRYPDVKLILSEEYSASQIQRLRDRATDIMFVYQDRGLVEARDLAAISLRQEQLVVVLPEKHGLTNKSLISLVDLASEEFILPDRHVVPGLFAKIYSLCEQAGFEPKVAQEAIFMVTILGLVAGELGIGILPDSVQNLQRQGVVYRSISQQMVTGNQLNIVWRKDDSSPIVPHFIKITQEVLNNEK
jgi:DNA-binding transcriptional LysR family regulator